MDILPQLLVNALIAGSLYALAGAGLSLTYGLLRILNFAHGHFMMFGAYLFYFGLSGYMFSQEPRDNASLILAGIFVLIAIGVFSMFALKVFIEPFRRYSSFLPFVTTLALGTMLESMVAILWGVNVKSFESSYIESIVIYGVYITPIQIFIIISALVILGVLGIIIHGSPFGRKIRSVAEHEFAAASAGVDATLLIYTVFAVSSVLAAFSGIMVGYESNLQPGMGSLYTIKVFAAMVLGGLGNLWGTVIGAYILALVENLAVGLDFGFMLPEGYNYIPAGYKDAIAYTMILVILLFRPTGIFNWKKAREV